MSDTLSIDLSDKIAVLSEIEEARSLQYQCECIESAFVEQGRFAPSLQSSTNPTLHASLVLGLEFHDPKVIETLKLWFRDDAPTGYNAWLDKNLAQYDPVARGLRLRDSLPLRFRNPHSFKCWDERCMHYVYGFSNQDDRDQHAREHVIASKRDSGLSVGGTPPLIFPDHSGHRNYSVDYSKQSSPVYLPRPGLGNSLQVGPLHSAGLSRDHRDSLRSYSFISEYPGHSQPRGSVDSEVDPLLPPLKRSRVGQSKLESIEELRLLRDIGPCLRCKVLNKGVSIAYESKHCPMTNANYSSVIRMILAQSAQISRALMTMTFGVSSDVIEVRWILLRRSCFQV